MPNNTAAFRVLDAALNRAGEGLRVVEDFVRFVLDDPQLTGLTKQLRHDLAEAAGVLAPGHRLAARETTKDVGTRISTPTESLRADSESVCRASIRRVCEAIRSVEEYGKLVDAGFAGRVEQLRYRAYTLERCVGIHVLSRDRLDGARLYVLLDGRSNKDDFAKLVEAIIGAGVGVIQLRDKRLSDRELIDRARWLVACTRGTATLAVINDRPDVAAVVQADGVHVGQDELSVKDARSVVGADALIGVSTHSVEQVAAAVLDGANYLGVGPVFASNTKDFDSLPGLALIRKVADITQIPWFPIGGIAHHNIDQVLDAGATRAAVCSAVVSAERPVEAARELIERIYAQ